MAPHITVTFDPIGGPLSAVASSGDANPGSYHLLLFAPDQLTLLREFAGRFATPGAHDIGAPQPLAGRLLHLLASVANAHASGDYSVTLSVRQNGRVIAEVKEVGMVSTETKEVDLFVSLEAGERFAAPTTRTASPTESLSWRRAPFIGSAQRFATLREATRAAMTPAPAKETSAKKTSAKKASAKKKTSEKKGAAKKVATKKAATKKSSRR